METKFFIGCKNPADLDAKYQEICQVFGLDKLPEESSLKQEVQKEYSALFSQMQPVADNQSKDETLTIKDVMASIKAFNLSAEVCGKWLWLTDPNAHVQRDQLKTLGFRYSPSKRSWYWRRYEDRSSNENPVSLEAIREKYGTQAVPVE